MARPMEKPFKDVGIDVGLHSYAVLSDGNRIENPRFYRKSEKRLLSFRKDYPERRGGPKLGQGQVQFGSTP